MGSPPYVDRHGTLTGSYEHRMASGIDGLVEVYILNEAVKGREGSQKGPKRTRTADIELKIALKRVYEKVELLRDYYQSHERYVREVYAQWSNNGGSVCILRSSLSDRVLKCYMTERRCVVLPPTHRADIYGLTAMC